MAAKKIKSKSPKPANDSETLSLDYLKLREVVLLLRALEHDIRKNIITMLDESEKLTVTELYIKLRIEQSVASQHLAILRRADVVLDERVGKHIYYSLHKKRLKEIAALIAKIA